MNFEVEAGYVPLRASAVAVWERLLGTSVGPDDDFFELGGYSMLAMEVCQTLRDDGYDVSVIDLVRNSRFDSFISAVAERRDKSVTPVANDVIDFESLWTTAANPRAATASSLVDLNTGKGTPVYVVHWGTGNIAFLGEYAPEMSGHRPLIGIANPGIRGRVRPLLSVGDLANAYVHDVMRTEPKRVLLAGLCSGGYIAVEMARLLRQLGVDVPLVGLVNTLPPNEPIGLDAGAGLRDLYEGRLAYLKTRFAVSDLDSAIGDVLAELTIRDVSYHDPDAGLADFYWLQVLWSGLTFAQVHYEPPSYDGAVHIFQTVSAAKHYPANWAGYVPKGTTSTYEASSTLPIIQHPQFPSDFRTAFDDAVDD